MTERDQVIDQSSRPADAVTLDEVGIETRDRAVDQHERQLVPAKRAQLRSGPIAHGSDQDALDAESEQIVEMVALSLQISVAVAEDHVATIAPRDVLGASDDKGEERVRNIGDEHSNRPTPGDSPWDVAELRDRTLDTAPRRLADPRLTIDDARHRHRGDSGQTGNIAHCHVHLMLL